jgi:hypothetical protein
LEELCGLRSEAIGVVKSELRQTKDLHLALQVLRVVGAVPSANELTEMQRRNPDELFDEYKLRVATQLGLVALERREVYGSELPISQDELDRRVQKAREREQSAEPTQRVTGT